MNSELHRLLNFLAESLDLARQTRIATRYRRSLDCKPCARPPLAISFPYPDPE